MTMTASRHCLGHLPSLRPLEASNNFVVCIFRELTNKVMFQAVERRRSVVLEGRGDSSEIG